MLVHRVLKYVSNNGINRKLITICLFICITFLVLFIQTNMDNNEAVRYKVYDLHPTHQDYLINTTNCKIPNIPPITDEIEKFVCKLKPPTCSNLQLLTYVENRADASYLKINQSAVHLYGPSVTCCYSEIRRVVERKSEEKKIRYTNCKPFDDEAKIIVTSIRVVCKNIFGATVYKNVHAVLLPRNKPLGDNNKFSVMLIGIDSISRLNFIRSLPKTYQHVENNFIELKGYNKIGDNTFPNLGGILTGMTRNQIQEACKYNNNIMDNCHFIWKDFKRSNYLTGYVEDEVTISTFNLDTLGFYEQPTDVYLRPYMTAAQELSEKKYYGMSYCTGPENTGQRVFNIIKDFASQYVNIPSFSLFWMNTFSHENINVLSTMDLNIYELLSDSDFQKNIENDTFVIFLSDHGFRFGNFRWTYIGWLEERLPFIYVHVPKNFKNRFPNEYNNFLLNRERLTTPYDLYMTLQHILLLSDSSYKVNSSQACPKCDSLFNVIKENRTCDDAAVEPHWCTCRGYQSVSTKNPIVIEIAQFVMAYINNKIESDPMGSACRNYVLDNIYSAAVSENSFKDNKTANHFLILIETKPEAMFEATVEKTTRGIGYDFQITGDISRLNKYSPHGQCTTSAEIKKYCYCKSKWDIFKNVLCFVFRC